MQDKTMVLKQFPAERVRMETAKRFAFAGAPPESYRFEMSFDACERTAPTPDGDYAIAAQIKTTYSNDNGVNLGPQGRAVAAVVEKSGGISIVHESGLYQPECGAFGYEIALGDFVKIGKGCYWFFREGRDKHGCAGQATVRARYLLFFDVEESLRRVYDLEVAASSEGVTRETSLSLAPCIVGKTGRCGEIEGGCSELAFKRTEGKGRPVNRKLAWDALSENLLEH